jgi:hypothetical protein
MAYSDNQSGLADERFSKRATYRNVTGTSDTLTLADVDAFITCSAAGATTVTIPATSSVSFPVGTIITIFSNGAGGVTVAKTGSDVLTGTATAAQNATRKIVKVSEASGVSTWFAFV